VLPGIIRPLPHEYIGQLATRCWVANTVFTPGTFGFNWRTYHYARDNITWMQVAWPTGFYGNPGADEAFLSPSPYTASIEYPAGVYHQMTWSGSTVCTNQDSVVFSDPIRVSIPKGAKFYTKIFQNVTSASIPLVTPVSGASENFCDATGGDIGNASGVDETMTTMSPDGFDSSGYMVPPMAIVGPTRQPSIAIIGDSRSYGVNDIPAANVGDTGQVARQLGPYFGYMNLALSGETASGFAGIGGNQRSYMTLWCSHVVCAFGINDIYGGATAAQVESSLLEIYNNVYISNKPIIQQTLQPESNSTDSWATTTNQTTYSINGVRNTVNTWIRGVPSPLYAIDDICRILEYNWQTGSGIWNAPNYTQDGIHCSNVSPHDGYALVAAGKSIIPARFHNFGGTRPQQPKSD